MLEESGLAVERIWGDYDGGPPSAEKISPVVLSKKARQGGLTLGGLGGYVVCMIDKSVNIAPSGRPLVGLYARSRNGAQLVALASALLPMAGIYASVVGMTRSFRWEWLVLYLASSATLLLSVLFGVRSAPALADRLFYAQEGYVRPPTRPIPAAVWAAYLAAFLLPAFLVPFGLLPARPASALMLVAFGLFEVYHGPRAGSLTDTLLGVVVLVQGLLLGVGAPVVVEIAVVDLSVRDASVVNLLLPTVLGSILVEWAAVAGAVLVVNRFAWRRLRA